jgi:hypothetical protein
MCGWCSGRFDIYHHLGAPHDLGAAALSNRRGSFTGATVVVTMLVLIACKRRAANNPKE